MFTLRASIELTIKILVCPVLVEKNNFDTLDKMIK